MVESTDGRVELAKSLCKSRSDTWGRQSAGAIEGVNAEKAAQAFYPAFMLAPAPHNYDVRSRESNFHR